MQVETKSFDVAVVGGGPAGLVAAILARQSGASVALVAPQAGRDERTVALLGHSVDVLRTAGAWPALEHHAAPLRTMRLIDATKRLIRAPLVEFQAEEVGLDAFGYNMANAALTEALDAQAIAVGVARIDAFATRISAGEDGVEIGFADQPPIAALLVGAADGRQSKARDAAGLSVRRWSYRQSALVTRVDHSLPHDEISTEFHTETGPFTLVPLPGQQCGIVCVERPDEAERLHALDDAALAAELERRSHHLLGRLAIAGKRQIFPLSGQTARHFAANRIALIGEAAHVFPPIGAQGLNLGLRDAAAFGALVQRHGLDAGAPDALAEYDRERSGDILSRTLAVDALNRSLLTDLLPIQALRGIGLFALDRVPPLRRALMRHGLAPRN